MNKLYIEAQPLAWVTAGTVDGQVVNGKPRRVWWENKEGCGMPIFTSPQPVARQAILNLSEAARSLGVAQAKDDQGAIDYWSVEVTRFEREARLPIPDVASLVTLLKHAQCPNCGGVGARYGSHGEPEQCQWCCERDLALASHRRGGSDNE